ncbi:hypothetical protein [Paenibacillus sp. 1P03SA]|uniref:hypothetical protein n=1 Tax=Paenibacillus sp. 1P03SA TaxID=3132294 RepID=UPI0039A0AC36
MTEQARLKYEKAQRALDVAECALLLVTKGENKYELWRIANTALSQMKKIAAEGETKSCESTR